MSIYDRRTKRLNEFGFKNPVIKKENKIFLEGNNMADEKNRPVNKVRIGLVQLSEWENKTKDDKTFSNFTIDVSYYDKEKKEFKKASSFSRYQLFDLKLMIDKILSLRCDIETTEK